MKPSKTPDFQKFMIRQLRKIGYMWTPRNEALKLAKVEYGVYACGHCKGHFNRKDLAIDHIEPVIAISGFNGWDEYIDRLFCAVENFQVLCKACHKTKTNIENTERRRIKSSVD